MKHIIMSCDVARHAYEVVLLKLMKISKGYIKIMIICDDHIARAKLVSIISYLELEKSQCSLK